MRHSDDILNLPEMNIIPQYLDMESKQYQFYNNIKQGIIDEVDKVDIKPSILLSLITRLRQATACPSILTSDKIDSIKIKRAVELSEEFIQTGSKVVIFSTYVESCYQLQEQLKKYNPIVCTGDSKIDIDTQVELFQNDPKYKVFIGTWQKCGTGQTLTQAKYMIHLDTA